MEVVALPAELAEHAGRGRDVLGDQGSQDLPILALFAPRKTGLPILD
jgi:hypothetical protein